MSEKRIYYIHIDDICQKGVSMPRPCKRRRICAMPEAMRFVPQGCNQSEIISMTLDEFETIRLIDLQGCTQEEASSSMDVARTTVQAIYESARHKLAQALCEGRELQIGGGNYILCEGRSHGCSCGRCQSNEKICGGK